MSEKRKHRLSWRVVLAIVIYAIGLCVLFYPVWSQWWNQRQQDSMIHQYDTTVSDQSEQKFQTIKKNAVAYNHKLYKRGLSLYNGKNKGLHYNKQLALPGSNVMAVLTIPSIDTHLPVYHGTSEQALEVGVGHMEETSLPVGGKNTHAVLTGHTGLPSGGTLFTPLVKLKKGQLFSIRVLNQTLYYQIDAIHVVKPNELKPLAIQKNQDRITLLTCTPYGVNSHRLLVQARRVPLDLSAPSNAKMLPPWQPWLVGVIAVIVVWGLLSLVHYARKKKQVDEEE